MAASNIDSLCLPGPWDFSPHTTSHQLISRSVDSALPQLGKFNTPKTLHNQKYGVVEPSKTAWFGTARFWSLEEPRLRVKSSTGRLPTASDVKHIWSQLRHTGRWIQRCRRPKANSRVDTLNCDFRIECNEFKRYSYLYR